MSSITSYKNIIKTSYWATLQMFFLQAGALVVTMYVTRMLSTSEYGLIPLINSLVVLLAVFVSLGLPSSLARYLAGCDAVGEQRALIVKVLLTSLPWMLIVLTFVSLMFPFLATYLNVPGLLELRWLFICVLLLEVFRVFLEKISHGTGNMRVSASYSGYASLSIVLITVPLVMYYPNSYFVLLAKIIALLIPSIRAVLSLRKILSVSFDLKMTQKIPEMREVFGYGIPLAAISLSGFGFIQLDMLFLAFYDTSSSVGLYSVGVILLMKFIEISKVIGFGISPNYAKSHVNTEQRAIYFTAGLKYSLIFVVPISILLLMESDVILGLVFGNKYSQAGDSLRILCLYFVMGSMLAIISPVLDFGGKAKIRAFAAIAGAVVNLTLNIILIPDYGLIGAAVATVIGYSILFFVTLITVFNIMPISGLNLSSIGRLIKYVLPILIVLSLIVHYFLAEMSFYVILFILITLYPIILYVFKVVEMEEIIAVKKMVFK